MRSTGARTAPTARRVSMRSCAMTTTAASQETCGAADAGGGPPGAAPAPLRDDDRRGRPTRVSSIIRIAAARVNSTGRRNTSMMRCCDAETETETVRPGGSTCDAFAWPAAGSGACGAATVLDARGLSSDRQAGNGRRGVDCLARAARLDAGGGPPGLHPDRHWAPRPSAS